MFISATSARETISIAIETAETGHLVFGTLHTTTAYSTIDRIIDQYPPDQQEQIRVMLSESLKGVVSQTLCKKIGGGRAAALEFLYVTPAVSNLIREGKTFQIPSIMQTSRNLGMRLLNEALIELVMAKKVAVDEAMSKAVDRTSLQQMLKSIKTGDRVLTSGGIYGHVLGVKEEIVVLKIAEDVKVEVAKTAIQGIIQK